MADFDVTDPSTWAWIDGYPQSAAGNSGQFPNGNYPHISDPSMYYAFSNGNIYEMTCPNSVGRPALFDPASDGCITWMDADPDAIYDSAVSLGVVNPDRRT